MRILVIEDHATLRESLVQFLREASFIVDATGTGNEGLWYAMEHPYDVVILDLMLPGIDGMEILRQLRKKQVAVFILVASARDALEDRLEALNSGADDYLVKPFPMIEALARIHALLRRKYAKKDPIIHIADLTLNPLKRSVHRADQPIELTAQEYRLLEYLAFRSGEVVSRTDIWEHELRTPIASLSATTELALSKPRDAEEYRRHLENCARTVSDLNALVTKLSALSRIGGKDQPARLEATSVHEVLCSSIPNFTPRAEDASITFAPIQGDPTLTVMADAVLLRLIFNNLLDNAISYAPNGSTVSIELRCSHNRVEVSFTNSCEDMPEELERLFEPLFRKDTSRTETENSHLGIGLTLSREAAAAMSARLSATMPAQGEIRFTLSLPMAK